MENLKAIDIIKNVVGKDMEIHVISGGEIEALSRHLLGEELRKNKKIFRQDSWHRGRDKNRIFPER